MAGIALFLFTFIITALILFTAAFIFFFKRSPKIFVVVIVAIILLTSYFIPAGIGRWSLVCLILFTASLVTGLTAIKRRDRNSSVSAACFFVVFILCGTYTLIKTGAKLFGIATKTFTEEEGEEIYTRMLGKPSDCVTILAAKGAYLPIIDMEEAIHYTTCPAEAERVLGGDTFQITTVAKSDFNSFIPGDKLFYTKGDSILDLYRPTNTTGGAVQIYLSMDSTEMFYGEVW